MNRPSSGLVRVQLTPDRASIHVSYLVTKTYSCEEFTLGQEKR